MAEASVDWVGAVALVMEVASAASSAARAARKEAWLRR